MFNPDSFEIFVFELLKVTNRFFLSIVKQHTELTCGVWWSSTTGPAAITAKETASTAQSTTHFILSLVYYNNKPKLMVFDIYV